MIDLLSWTIGDVLGLMARSALIWMGLCLPCVVVIVLFFKLQGEPRWRCGRCDAVLRDDETRCPWCGSALKLSKDAKPPTDDELAAEVCPDDRDAA